MKTIITKKRYIAIMIAGLMIISLIIVPNYNNRNVSNIDKHDWEWVPGFTNNEAAYDQNGKQVIHYKCNNCNVDLSIIMENKPWEKEDFGKGQEYWNDIVNNSLIGAAKEWHRYKYNCDGAGDYDDVYYINYNIPGYYQCKNCGCIYSEPNGLTAYYFNTGSDTIYDINRNKVNISCSTAYGINMYLLEHGKKAKYYIDSDWDGSCDHKSVNPDPDDPDEKDDYILNGDKVYDKNGKLVKGPLIEWVKKNGAYTQVYIKADGSVLKSGYVVYNSYLYRADSFGTVETKPNTTAITFDNKLYHSDSSGIASLLKNRTVTINGVEYTSDSNGNVTNNPGGESPGQDDDSPAGGDPTGGNPVFKNEYIDGIWYDSNGKADTKYRNGQWKNDSAGWWFEDNGWYPTSSWLKIDGKYYYFCADGYMDYSEYREGCWLNADGSWNESYSGGHWNEWSPGSGWWWYTDNTGYYPNSGSCWIDGHQYQFDADGWTYSK